MGRPRSWTDAQLRQAVAASTTFKEVHQRLGLKPGGGTHSAVRLRIAELGMDISHFEPRRRTARPRRPPRQESRLRQESDSRASPPVGPRLERIDPEELRAAVAASVSIRETLGRLGLGENGSTYAGIKAAMRRHGIDATHFLGQGWARGMQGKTRHRGRSLEEVLVADSPTTNTARLRQRLLRAGLKEHRCERCGLREWQGEPIPLQLDHVDGNRSDNRLENLRLLCPNCHSQTETWCGRNHGRYSAGR